MGSGQDIYHLNGNVGIGTTGPSSKLVVQADAPASSQQLVLQRNANPNKQLLLSYNTANNYGSIQPIEQGVAVRDMVLMPNGGNVGIGNGAPAQKLDVNGNMNVNGFITAGNITSSGNIKLGPTGQYFAPAAEENLRIVRGSFNASGTKIAGADVEYSVSADLVNAIYTITFTTAFSGRPTVTASGPLGGTLIQVTTSTGTSVAFRSARTPDQSPFASSIKFIAVGPR